MLNSFDVTWKRRNTSLLVMPPAAVSPFVHAAGASPAPPLISKVLKAKPNCFRLFVHWILLAFCCARAKAGGRINAESNAMTPTIIKSSTSVNASILIFRDRLIIDTPRPKYHRCRWHTSTEFATAK